MLLSEYRVLIRFTLPVLQRAGAMALAVLIAVIDLSLRSAIRTS